MVPCFEWEYFSLADMSAGDQSSVEPDRRWREEEAEDEERTNEPLRQRQSVWKE
jgi:hypothetical protein